MNSVLSLRSPPLTVHIPSPQPPLTSALVVLRGTRIAVLLHVVAAISNFLDFALPQFWILPRPCEANLRRLPCRLVACGISNGVDSHYWRYPCSKALVSAVKHDNLEMVEWLHALCPSVLPYSAMVEAAKTGNLDMLQWLAAHHERVTIWIPEVMAAVASTGKTEMLQWLFDHPWSDDRDSWRNMGAYYSAIEGEHLETLQWFYDRYEIISPLDRWCGVQNAINRGHTDAAKFLLTHARKNAPELSVGISCAAEQGDLELVQWVDSKLPSSARTREAANSSSSQWPFDGAARGGHLHVVQWFHENRREGCTTYAMDWATSNDHLHVLHCLHANRTEGCTSREMDWAAEKGHLEVVQ